MKNIFKTVIIIQYIGLLVCVHFFYMRQYNLFQLVKISGSNQFAQSHVYEYPISSYIRKFGLSIQYRQDGLIVQFIKRRIFGENIFCTF